jgi:hypothetical protein
LFGIGALSFRPFCQARNDLEPALALLFAQAKRGSSSPLFPAARRVGERISGKLPQNCEKMRDLLDN